MIAVLVELTVVGFGTSAAAPANPGLNPPQWTATQDGPPKYPGVAIEPSVSIRMADGTILKGDVYRPADTSGRATTDKNPVIVNITPYNKLISIVADWGLHIPVLTPAVLDFINSLNFTGTPISGIRQFQDMIRGGMISSFGVDRKLVQSGYTQIVVDARGTGTSDGTWQVFNDIEQHDTLDVLAWARNQPYSNGKLGMSGVSYSAINQLQAAAKQPAGLDAIFPVEPMTDIVHDVVAPGAGLGVGFLSLWLSLVNGLNKVPDLQGLLRGQFDQAWLDSRVKDPLVFFNQLSEAIAAPTVQSLSPNTRELIQVDSSLRKAYLTAASNVKTPAMVIGGWNDIFTNAEWRALDQLSGLSADKKKLIMGTGYHVTPGADMGNSGQPPRIDVLQRAWFDKWLKGIDNGIDRYSPATINIFNGGWVQADSFPLPGQQYRRLYLNSDRSGTAPGAVADGSLAATKPVTAAKWTVAPGLSTICSNDAARDSTGILAVFPGCADDNRIAEQSALTFTSPQVSAPTQISGPINVHLNTQVDGTDGFFSTVISDVSPDGRSRVISTGSMTTSIRNQVEPAKSGYSSNGDLTDPYYTLDVDTRQLVKPGEISMLDIGALATGAVLQPGHRLRVSVYSMNFPRSISLGPVRADSGLLPEHVVLDPNNPSWVNVPSDRPIA
ncbi:CocE/NonD family hydrolase [Antrihabitans cavernicola]|uniref:CocE/NonD family hydrolase n=1 Tax=Antrihabitans cavernicola TaxID=2495913 RepID=UPI00338DB08F